MSKVQIDGVHQGMILGEPIYLNGRLLMKQGMRLKKEQIRKLKDMGIGELEISDPFTIFVDIYENMEFTLEDCYKKVLKKISSPHSEGNMNDAVVDFLPILNQTIREICTNSSVCEICVDMQVIDFEKLVRGGVYTSCYSMFLVAIKGMEPEEIRDIGIAGLLHEVGLCEMFQLIGQTDITGNNRALWEQHPMYGHYMMLEREVSKDVADMICSHHERYDGKGFPKGLTGEDIPFGARIISLCADYDENVNSKGYLPYEAIEYIYGNSGGAYDSEVVKLFTENIPIYPLGAVVELSTGETGVVVNIRKNRGPRPVVQVLYNRVHKPMSSARIVDLGREKTVFIKKVITY